MEDGVFISVDFGVTWSAWNFGLLDWRVYTLAISPGYTQDRKVYIGTETGLCVSTNRGRSWHELPYPPEGAPVQSITLNQQESGGLLLRVESEAGEVFMSEDEGQSWELLPGR